MTAAKDGAEALDAWRLNQARIVISDWVMPEMDGLELCRRIRAEVRDRYTYYILLTGRSGRESYLTAMDAGIDDFITKPVDGDELKARLRVAERILGLRKRMDDLEGLLPICSYCKRIRNDHQQWSGLEGYIEQRSGAEFSHGVCPIASSNISSRGWGASLPPRVPVGRLRVERIQDAGSARSYSGRLRARSADSFFRKSRYACAARLGVVPGLSGAGPQHEDEQVGRCLLSDRIGLPQTRRLVASRQLQETDVEVRIEAHGRELLVGADRHRHEELHAVLLSLLLQAHHAIEQALGTLLGGHLTDIGRRMVPPDGAPPANGAPPAAGEPAPPAPPRSRA